MMNMGIGKILKQAQQMQKDLARIKEELAQQELEVTGGGGAIRITITGDQNFKAVRIDPSAVREADAEMLSDMVLAAVNQAMEESRKLSESKMQKIAGGLNIPGMDMGALGF